MYVIAFNIVFLQLIFLAQWELWESFRIWSNEIYWNFYLVYLFIESYFMWGKWGSVLKLKYMYTEYKINYNFFESWNQIILYLAYFCLPLPLSSIFLGVFTLSFSVLSIYGLLSTNIKNKCRRSNRYIVPVTWKWCLECSMK